MKRLKRLKKDKLSKNVNKKVRLETLEESNSRSVMKVLQVVGLFLMTSFLLITTGCNRQDPVNESQDIVTKEVIEPALVVEDFFLPVMWIQDEVIKYQPSYGYKTKMDYKNIEDYHYPLDKKGISFIKEFSGEQFVSTTIYDGKGEIVHKETYKPKLIVTEELSLIEVDLVASNEMAIGQSYLIEVEIMVDQKRGYYYYPITYVEENKVNLDQYVSELKSELKTENVTLANEARIWLDYQDDDSAMIISAFTGAKRLSSGFDYLDYEIIYKVDVTSEELIKDIVKGSFVDKQRYFYDSKSGWKLGKHSNFVDESLVDMRRISENDKYQVIYSEDEMLLFNKESQSLEEIYRLDMFNSDYIYDEYNNHKLDLLKVSDEGAVYFTLYGYHNHPDFYYQRNGISFYKYWEGTLTLLGFIEKNLSIEQLEIYMEDHSYYSRETDYYHFVENQGLYSFDMITGLLSYVDTFPIGSFQKEKGILVWQGDGEKYNESINYINLNKYPLNRENVNQTGVFKHLLEVGKTSFIVGVYKVEDTYEALNGDVTYSYHTLEVYDFDGKLIRDYKDSGRYYGEVYYEEKENKYVADLISMSKQVASNSKQSRIHFATLDLVSLDTMNEELEIDDKLEDSLLNTTYPDNIIAVEEKEDDRIYIKDPISLVQGQTIVFDGRVSYRYVLIDSFGKEFYATSLKESFVMSENMTNYKIVYRFNGSEKELYQSSWLSPVHRIQDISIIPQRPELPRGCEVTSLAILLDYYMEESPDKMELASEVSQSVMDYKVIDGFVNYSDMHVEFAGSQGDTTLPGLGVYIEPVQGLALDYIDGDRMTYGPLDISGLSFDQMLGYISADYPVLIIVPNRYKNVQEYSIEVWNTPNGFMEVTYQEHSVVVIGFDEQFVYYSDPSKGKIDQKPIEDFKNAWESIGKQALIIVTD